MPASPLDELPATTGDAVFSAALVSDLLILLVRRGVIAKSDAVDMVSQRLSVMERSQAKWPGHPVALESLLDNLRELISDIMSIFEAPTNGDAAR